LILASLLIALILALVLTKKMTVRVPVCERHVGYWKRRGLTLGLSFLAVVGFAIGALIATGGKDPGKDIDTGLLCLGAVLLFVAWLFTAAIYQTIGMRPIEITDRFIRFTGVSKAFVDAIEDDRERDRQEEVEYRRRRRAQRDDRDLDQEEPRPPQIDRRREDDDLERRARG
jgi:hypothetical protein